MTDRLRVVYVTSSSFKAEENQVFVATCLLDDGTPVSQRFDFEIREVPIQETLEVRLEAMVEAEAISAYSQIKVPCIVEHAGLIFEDHSDKSYPGGLTKPMWNALGDRFIQETQSAGRKAVARAVVGYCDGMSVRTYVGETEGTLADQPRGSRRFYWDTIFVPDDSSGQYAGKTYAEIVELDGLAVKVVKFSQSARAMLKFLNDYASEGLPILWR